MHFLIINGPNLNLLGIREPSIYGDRSFDQYLEELRGVYDAHHIDYFQSNVEGEIINKLQEAGFVADGIILNAGGYTHTSVAIADCIRAISTPVIEVHLSNIYARENFRRKSLLAPACRGGIYGFGLNAYRLAIEGLLKG